MHDPYIALRNPEFRFFLALRLFITLAIQIEAVIVGWQVYEITQDALSLGLIGLAEAIPAITVALYAGHLADIGNRKHIILVCLLVLLLCGIALLTITTYSHIIPKNELLIGIYVIIFFTGVARGFMSPTTSAFMGQIVSQNIYKNAVTWNSNFWQSAAVVGPALAGLLYGYLGIQMTYSIQVILVILALIAISLIASKSVPAKIAGERVRDRIKEGLNFVFKNQLLLSSLSLDLFAVLFGGAVALLPIFAKDILHIGAEGLGFLRAAPAIGAVMTATFLAYKPIGKNASIILLFCVAGFGISTILFAISTNFLLSFFCLFMTGAFDSVSVVIRSTLVQLLTPNHMKGRVSAVNNIFIGSSNEIGAFESGAAAKLMGVVQSVIFGGSMTILVVLITSFSAKKLLKLDLSTVGNEHKQ
jgi:MFS family permease